VNFLDLALNKIFSNTCDLVLKLIDCTVMKQETVSFEKPLRIGLDGRMLIGKPTGVGRYVIELAKCLDKLCPGAEFFIYSNKPISFAMPSSRWRLSNEPLTILEKIPASVWYKLAAGRLCRRDHIDVFWAGATLLPFGLSSQTRIVSTVYDLVHKIAPETMATTLRFLHEAFFALDVRRADCVLSISEGTSLRLNRFVGRKADGVIYPAVNDTFFPQSKEIVNDCLMRYQVSSPYLLAVATWEPRKNLELLIITYLEMKKAGLVPYQLVLVGGKGWKDERLTSLFEQISRNHVKPLGYVPDSDLPALYTGAEVFIFPSKYEGFGIPVLEARVCGTQVVTTDIPELREAGGESCIYIKPTKEGIWHGLLQAGKQKAVLDSFVPPSWHSGAILLARALFDISLE
jgi:glycosyltransferase involved in cell wall biosynthesis